MKVTLFALFLGCAAIIYCPLKFLWSDWESAAAGRLIGMASRSVPEGAASSSADESPAAVSGPGGGRSQPLSKTEAIALIRSAALKYHVPEVFLTSIVAAESNFDCGAISPKGAIGLMQLMPETARQFGADPAVPAENVDAGTRYIRWLILRYQNSSNAIRHVIAAYNAGPAVVDRYRGVPPFPETRAYVARVLGFVRQFSGRRYAPAELMIRDWALFKHP